MLSSQFEKFSSVFPRKSPSLYRAFRRTRSRQTGSETPLPSALSLLSARVAARSEIARDFSQAVPRRFPSRLYIRRSSSIPCLSQFVESTPPSSSLRAPSKRSARTDAKMARLRTGRLALTFLAAELEGKFPSSFPATQWTDSATFSCKLDSGTDRIFPNEEPLENQNDRQPSQEFSSDSQSHRK